jgi:hypothetical protein
MNQPPHHHSEPRHSRARQGTRMPLPAPTGPPYHEVAGADSPTGGTPHHEADRRPTWHTKEVNQL